MSSYASCLFRLGFSINTEYVLICFARKPVTRFFLILKSIIQDAGMLPEFISFSFDQVGQLRTTSHDNDGLAKVQQRVNI